MASSSTPSSSKLTPAPSSFPSSLSSQSISCHTRCNWSPEVRFEWTLHDFENLFETLGAGAGKEVYSDPFSVAGFDSAGSSNTFRLQCQRIDDDSKRSDVGEFLGIFLSLAVKEDTKITYSVGVRDKSGTVRNKQTVVAKTFGVADKNWGWYKAVSMAGLKADRDNLLADGNLTLSLELTVLRSGYISKTDSLKFDNSRTLTEDLSELLTTNPETTDFIIVCQGREFPCHKTVLAARSPVFKAMFAHEGFEEDTSGRVLVEDFTPEVVEVMVKAAYSDKISDVIKGARGDDGGDLVCDLFRAVEKYEMKSLKVACEKILAVTLDLKNCARIMHWALACNGDTLTELTRKFIQENIGKILSTAAFRDLMAAFPDAMLSQGEKTEKKKMGPRGMKKFSLSSKKKKM